MLDTRKVNTTKSFLQRLRTNNAGNTFAMAAAAMFPIAGVIGGGVDIGRAYMAKARLQQACDAGALAGRRSMSGEAMSAEDKVQARKYFDFNFPEGTFATNPFETVEGQPNPRFVDGFTDEEADRTVVGYAETTIDTSIMKIFGYQTMEIKVDCTSRLDVGNVDVMMVLDVTGSMKYKSGGKTRLEGLQESVEDFYTILGPGGGADGSQIRYGFIPYNLNVNVGQSLVDANPEWVVGGAGDETEDKWTYQSRQVYWNVPVADPIIRYEMINVANADGNDRAACIKKFGVNQPVPPLWEPADKGYPVGNGVIKNGHYFEFSYAGYHRFSKNVKSCIRRVKLWIGGPPAPSVSTVWEPGATFNRFEYDIVNHDVSAFVESIDPSNPAVVRPTLNNWPSNAADGPLDRWNGCIEERDTYADITDTTNAIPENAYDLDIDLIPENKATRWRPSWPGVMYKRNGWGAKGAKCPVAGRRLAQYADYNGSGVDSDGNTSSGNLKNYIDSFVANGGTNHTAGMIWGARFLSENGIFKEENKKTSNGFAISRHIVFMTDGLLTQYKNFYDIYGYHDLDGRLAPAGSNNSELTKRQKQRFKLICNAIKKQGTVIWIVHFSNSNTPDADLAECATSPGHLTMASDNDALKDAFGNIAKTIGGLRLSK